MNEAEDGSAAQILSHEGGILLRRIQCRDADGDSNSSTTMLVACDRAAHDKLSRLCHEFELTECLDSNWALRPLEFVQEHGQTILVFEDPGGELLSRLLDAPLGIETFLRLAIDITAALGKMHQRGLVHKDIKPSNFLVNNRDGATRLKGFGIASRIPRERQAPGPPEFIAGTLAYMAPEQTGRMNRSIDSRSDLYALGVTFYQMLTGSLPFDAIDAMEWVHCHIARQPRSPSERTSGIPYVLSSIVMKLLAKTAEGRYQTAGGVEADLRRCLTDWQCHGRIEPFPVAVHDISNQLLIPEHLYGREFEIASLLASFERVVAGGRPELVLVSGYSGVGKSSVVNELHKPLVPPRGRFASGKFDQYKRDIPYATLAQAFQSLIRPILATKEEELGRWRDRIREALGPNGQLMVDLVPELKLIIGDQLPVPELPPKDAQSRFQLVFRRFIGAFTREHPLALFLDDLQWLDAATLDLVADLLTHPGVNNLLLIGAYRDNEVAAAHPLMRRLDAMHQAGATLLSIVLAPLTRENLEQLIADSLRCEPGHACPLAGLVKEKTAGNPFFAIQFLSALFEEGLLIFDQIEGQWHWDLNRIHAKGYTDNVVDLMVGKLNRLPTETQKALQQLACLGNSADFAMLRMVYQDSSEELHGQLWEAVRTGLIFRIENSYTFLHDRVQEAAYSLIPQQLRAAAHLRIGMQMASHTSPDKLEEEIFEIANQLNRGSHLITSIAERERIVELNLIAGRRAKISTAYASALRYLHAGRGLMMDDAWNRNYDLVFSIEYLLAECELLTADMSSAESRLSVLVERAKSAHDIALVTRLRLTLYDFLGRSDRGVEVFIEYERGHGNHWSPHPTDEEVSREYDQIWSLVGTRKIEQLADLPLITNPDVLDVLDVFNAIVMPAMFTDENLHALVVCRMVRLSLEHGNSDASCFAYVSLSMLAGPHFGDYEAGFQLGKLGYDLVEKHGLHRAQARVYLRFGNCIMPWRQHVKTGRQLLRRAFDAASGIGDLTFAAYSYHYMLTNLLASGDSLADVQREAETGLEFASKVVFGIVIHVLTAQLAFVRTLRGLTTKFGSLSDGHFDETQFELQSSRNPMWALAECRYWIRKLQARFLAGDCSSAIEASLNAGRLLWTSHSFFEVAEYHFYGALARAAAFDSASEGSRQQHFEALADHYRQLAIWADNCPENFENRAALVRAEIARIEGRELEAMRLYEQAIRSAGDHGFVHNEAVAYEAAARFYHTRGSETSAGAHLRKARDCYLRWGADGKVRQLDQLYPKLAGPEAQHPVAILGSTIQHLDVASVVKASQALSGEIVMPRLIERLMEIAIENAGADRGVLILPSGDEYRIQAEARARGDQIEVTMRQEPITGINCPESLVRYAIRTLESVILDDASKPSLFSGEDYLRDRQSKSILCLPLMKQRELIGILLLENALVSHAFTPARIAVLELLAGQAAISLENTRLYGDLAQAAEHRKQSEIYLAGEKHVLEMIASGQPLREVLAAICRFFEESAPECHCGIYPIDGRNKIFEFGVAPSLPASYTNPIRGASIAFDDSPRSRSISEKTQVIAEDIGSDPRWMDAPCRAHVLEHGLRAVWSTPVCSREGAVIGTVCVYQREPGGPSSHHQETIAHVAHLASIAIERSQAEAGLKRSEFYLTEGQRVSLTGTFAWDLATDEISFSDQLKRIWEFEPFTEVTYDMLSERTHPDDLARLYHYRQRMRAGLTNPDYELRLRMPDGRIKYLWVSARAMSHEGGRLECLGAAQDITRRRLAEDARDKVRSELAHVSRVVSLGALTASIAHEVNQPLASILTSGETALRWLNQPEPNFEKVQQVLKRVVNDARRAADVIDRVRTMASKGASRRSETALADIIKECTALLHQEFQSKNVSNSLDLAPDLPKVMVDRTQLQQVIVNLVVNAVQAITISEVARRDIAIRTQQIDSETVCCIVEDSGPGIDAEHLPRLFDSFFTTKATGMGLGLPIARSIIEAYNGTIRADNSSSLGGARLIIELPASFA
ncbi:trifunctional serine/threonine-protein kinase/ATP-binding protein/sensor histidine kinase [Bradyrhizobium canariense]|uniref:trifunctional serine/threonine-protein kinase/ATP-binding protein/sensor histidine kinase n=1 Tax=Bradyrhizobium canariense TaxID=255045 RepID=UPI000A194565|nr:trifunctional serine/threonine-protein kinase/ATP-binding protein/sensor histidine kinase [Bradyrhizobium canariense]